MSEVIELPDTGLHYSVQRKVLFRHCDPAGIAFYPRILEIVNDTIEELFNDLVGWPFEELHESHAAPTVALEASFAAVSRHGDLLDLSVTLERLGNTSLRLRTDAWCAEEHRFSVVNTMVCIKKNGGATSWPMQVRGKLERTMEAAQ